MVVRENEVFHWPSGSKYHHRCLPAGHTHSLHSHTHYTHTLTLSHIHTSTHSLTHSRTLSHTHTHTTLTLTLTLTHPCCFSLLECLFRGWLCALGRGPCTGVSVGGNLFSKQGRKCQDEQKSHKSNYVCSWLKKIRTEERGSWAIEWFKERVGRGEEMKER